jgi:hypothetical protein
MVPKSTARTGRVERTLAGADGRVRQAGINSGMVIGAHRSGGRWCDDQKRDDPSGVDLATGRGRPVAIALPVVVSLDQDGADRADDACLVREDAEDIGAALHLFGKAPRGWRRAVWCGAGAERPWSPPCRLRYHSSEPPALANAAAAGRRRGSRFCARASARAGRTRGGSRRRRGCAKLLAHGPARCSSSGPDAAARSRYRPARSQL